MAKKKQLLNESWLEMLGSWSKSLINYMYDDPKMVATLKSPNIKLEEDEGVEHKHPKFVIRGKHRDVKAYATALIREKEYIDAYVKFGSLHPNTAKKRAILDSAVEEFESATGLLWPFRDEE